jgi:hypothetical protein
MQDDNQRYHEKKLPNANMRKMVARRRCRAFTVASTFQVNVSSGLTIST